MQQINLGGKIIDFKYPLIMGILNITPDSFFDGGAYKKVENALNQTEKMISEGADIIDVGAVSTRPNATEVSVQEELERLIPVIKAIDQRFPDVILSIDTFRSSVIKAVLEIRPFIVNDISAGQLDPHFLSTVAENQLPYILMHMQGLPQNMQDNPQYDVITMGLLNFFSEKLNAIKQLGIEDVIIDPGFGFGKSVTHNYEILKKLEVFNIFEKPVLVGLSRKSMIYKCLETGPENALNGTTVLNTIALMNGAKILRVHDVQYASETRKLWNQLQDAFLA